MVFSGKCKFSAKMGQMRQMSHFVSKYTYFSNKCYSWFRKVLRLKEPSYESLGSIESSGRIFSDISFVPTEHRWVKDRNIRTFSNMKNKYTNLVPSERFRWFWNHVFLVIQPQDLRFDNLVAPEFVGTKSYISLNITKSGYFALITF